MSRVNGPPGSTVVVKKGRRRGPGAASAPHADCELLPRCSSAAVEPVDLRDAYKYLLSEKRGSPFTASFAKSPIPRGIVNNGNFCFMNAILQALIFTPAFAQLAVSAVGEAERCPTLSALGKWMLSYWARGLNQTIVPPRLPFASPRVGNGAKHSLPSQSSSSSPFTGGGRAAMDGSAQEDAHEFLHRMLEVIQAELVALEAHYEATDSAATASGAVPPASSSMETKGWTFVKGRERFSVREHVDESRSLLFDAVFGGSLQSHLKGKSKLKDHASVVVERFFSLPVDVGFRADCKIEEALEFSMQTERVNDDARAKDLLKTVRLHRLPTILMLQLRRWAVTAEGELVKLDNTVRLARTLVLPKSTCADEALSSRERTYELVAFVAHRGRATERGHYVAYVVSSGDGNKLTLCNDVRLSDATMEETVEKETVYFLVYKQKR